MDSQITEKQMMEIYFLPVKLMETIFARLSLKCLSRMKCVSKSWYNLITRLRKSCPRSTSLGIVLQSRTWPRDVYGETSISLLAVQDHGEKCIVRNSYHVNIEEPYILDSCNGLLLCGSISQINYVYDLYIASPILQQCRSLPPLGIKSHDLAFARIIFRESQEHFNVICRVGTQHHVTGTTKLHIFESKSWEWREQNAEVICTSPFGLWSGRPPCVFLKEEMYMECDKFMVIYSIEKATFRCVTLPKTRSNSQLFGKLLWVSEGSVYYGVSSADADFQFHIWRYEGDNQSNNSDQVNIQWRLSKMSLPRENVKLKFKRMNLADHRVEVIAFNDDMQVLYLGIVDINIILAYSFETGKLTKVLDFPFSMDTLEKQETSINFYCWREGVLPFTFNPVNLPNVN